MSLNSVFPLKNLKKDKVVPIAASDEEEE